MMAKRAVLGFLTDQNVPDDVVRCLEKRGHIVSRVRDEMPADSPDPVVALAAISAGRILLSWDRDFNDQRFMRDRFRLLSRIGFSCPYPEGATRLMEVIDLIEYAFARSKGAPVRIRVAKDKVQISG
ncbi:MAG: DUF5615 family PIN-like protein [Tabrizicola sp.]|nr:DUF5615 family PIN-like protein [Tabrizicola sp.]